MRRSKVQRQEARRERKGRTSFRAKKEEKSEPTRYTVVYAEDVRQPKYLFCGSDSFDGYPLEHAERLAAPVPGQQSRYAVLPLEVHRWARGKGEPMSPKAAIAGYEKEAADVA